MRPVDEQPEAPQEPSAVVFYMDGLLFDTETLYQEAIYIAAAEAGDVTPVFHPGMTRVRG